MGRFTGIASANCVFARRVAIERDGCIAFARLLRELDLDGEPGPDPRPPRRWPVPRRKRIDRRRDQLTLQTPGSTPTRHENG
jgi:hypothetical protein